jgi:hypothetical protein
VPLHCRAVPVDEPVPRRPDVVAQREAMRRLDFLVAKWSGPATVALGPGDPLRLTRTEQVERKLDGPLSLQPVESPVEPAP